MPEKNFELYNSTTFSGSDTQVFIYRDLVNLMEKEKKGLSSRDRNATTSSERISNEIFAKDLSLESIRDQVGPVTDGGVPQKSGEKQGKSINHAPSNYVDSKKYIEAQQTAAQRGAKQFVSSGIGDIVKELGSLHSLSYSSFREKNAVRTLGRTHAKAYTRGQRTIAGTMIFNILQAHELMDFANAGLNDSDHVAMLDQIEPFNLIISFTNEYGAVSVMHLFNVDVNTESQSMSIDQIGTSNTMSFYAQDMLPITNVGNLFKDTHEMLYSALSSDSYRTFVSGQNASRLSGLKSLGSALGGSSDQDKRIQALLKRSRGLF
jgi:hypothetical protein